MQSYNMMSCGELESTKNNNYFMMYGFSDPAAKVDVSNFIMSFALMNINLEFVGESCQMKLQS